MRHWLSKLVLFVTLAAFLAANVVGPRMANAVAHGGAGDAAGVVAATTGSAVSDDGALASAAMPCHGAADGPPDAADPAAAVPDHGCCVAACAALGFPPAAAVPAGPPAVTARPSMLAPVLVSAAPALLDRPPRHV